MDIEEVTRRARERAKTRTHADRVRLLREAHIIDEDGYYKQGYFSEETIAQDKANRKPIIL